MELLIKKSPVKSCAESLVVKENWPPAGKRIIASAGSVLASRLSV